MMKRNLYLVLWPILLTPAPALAQEQEIAGTDDDVIVVTATRSERSLEQVPASISVQNVDELRTRGFSYGTDEFRGVPGVSFRRGEGDADLFPFVSVRGSTGTDGYLALLDGVPFVGVFDEPLLAAIPYDALERIEVVKGRYRPFMVVGRSMAGSTISRAIPTKTRSRVRYRSAVTTIIAEPSA